MTRRTLWAAAALVVAACGGRDPRPIVLNEDACAYCRMTIADARFGGEVVMRTGRIETFDAVECMAAWVRAADPATIAGIYVVDLQHPGTLVPAATGGFLRGALVPSPMGRAISAFVSPEAAEQQRAMLGGRVVSWDELVRDSVASPATRP